MTTLGIGDRPVTGKGDDIDRLGIDSYAKALTKFAVACDTPLTIGLQGDWGSGKTSLMQLMLAEISKGKHRPATIWINTWKYAQLGNPETLFLAVLQGVVEALGDFVGEQATNKTTRIFKQIRRGALGVGKVALNVGTKVASQGLLAGEDFIGSEQGEATPPHRLATELKDGLEDLVEKAAGIHGGRVLLFVDDLDRIPPERAVQILEALKNFLDVPGLVTVLACDYGVISRGLEKRMGVGEDDLGRSFFDKIIQVPFRMPTHAYQADKYVAELLRRVKVKATDAEVGMITEMLRHSVGLNPRSLKRHANTLLLLLEVARHTPSLAKSIDKDRRPLIMLGLTAMEAKYRDLHRFLARALGSGLEPDKVQVVELLMSGLLPDPNKAPWAERWVVGKDSESDEPRLAIPELRSFLEAFCKLVDADDSKSLEDSELEVLRDMVLLASVSSVGPDEPTRPARKRRTKEWTAVEIASAFPDIASAVMAVSSELQALPSLRVRGGRGKVNPTLSFDNEDGDVIFYVERVGGSFFGTFPRVRCLELHSTEETTVVEKAIGSRFGLVVVQKWGNFCVDLKSLAATQERLATLKDFVRELM